MGERWQRVSHCHPPPLLTFPPLLTPASQRGGGQGDALQAMPSPPQPKGPIPFSGSGCSPVAMQTSLPPFPDSVGCYCGGAR